MRPYTSKGALELGSLCCLSTNTGRWPGRTWLPTNDSPLLLPRLHAALARHLVHDNLQSARLRLATGPSSP